MLLLMKSKLPPKPDAQALQREILAELRAFGLAFPEAHLKSPWPGHKDLAVRDKTFAYLSIEGEPFSISCKLPRSNAVALMLPFSSPTAYGLGRSGWVTAKFAPDEIPPLEMLKAWIDESYRAQAPKRLVARLPALALQAPTG
jgi:predicted DNA-binding protein (MmcQ/YjbR family)